MRGGRGCGGGVGWVGSGGGGDVGGGKRVLIFTIWPETCDRVIGIPTTISMVLLIFKMEVFSSNTILITEQCFGSPTPDVRYTTILSSMTCF